ncbi:LacI family DNA-binding transcriptional regulator [Micromonospora sp. M12]
MGRNRATLADVARKAGLSKTAASMVLNGREGTRLSAEAHQRVFAAAEELGYRPNLAARSLRTRKTATIAFVSDIVATTRFAGDLIRGALDAARERDHVLLITETQGDATFEQYAIEAVLDRQVDGVIYAAMATRRLTVPGHPRRPGGATQRHEFRRPAQRAPRRRTGRSLGRHRAARTGPPRRDRAHRP